MKLAKTFEGAELSRNVLRSIEDITEQIVADLIEGYDTQLFKDGKHLSAPDKQALGSFLKNETSIKLTVAVSISEKTLDDLYIYPTDNAQALLTSFPSTEHLEKTLEGNADAD